VLRSVSLVDLAPALAIAFAAVVAAQAIYGTLGVGAVTAALTIASGWLYGGLGPAAFAVMAGICLAAVPVALSMRSVVSGAAAK
jgi:PPP family 3-phenylpropionic acid transporter